MIEVQLQCLVDQQALGALLLPIAQHHMVESGFYTAQLKLNRLAIQGAFEAVNQSTGGIEQFHNSLAIQACAVDPERSVRWVRVYFEIHSLQLGHARDVVNDNFNGLCSTVRIGYSQHVGAGGYVIQHRLGTHEVVWTRPSEFIREGTTSDNHVD